jgi:formylmethanofuran dehydrogenase subunit E
MKEPEYDVSFNPKTVNLLTTYACATGQTFHICEQCGLPFVSSTSNYANYDGDMCIKCAEARFFPERRSNNKGKSKWE